MQPESDAQLLRHYVEHGSETAFAEIVTRHTNLVYSAALRQVDSAEAAADVTQSVFIGLARAARSLVPRLTLDASLAGWLCRSARNIALNLRRDEFRRHSRERLVMENLNPTSETAPDWERLRPVLDEAMAELDERDYDALVMRFFKNQDLRSVGLALGVSDDTAQKRVARALDKLRQRLSRRGITTSAGALSLAICANAVQAAPVGLAPAISSAASLAGMAIQTAPAIAATKAIAMTTLQKTLVTAVIAVSVTTPLLLQRDAHARWREQDETLRQQAARLDELRVERESLSNQLAEGKMSEALPNESPNEVLRLRGEVGRLQAALQELRGSNPNESPSREEVLASIRQLYVDRVNGFKQRFVDNPAEAVPELQYLTERDWLEFVTYDHHRIDPDNLRAMSNARSRAQTYFAHRVLEDALRQYGKDHNEQFPTDLSQLSPYVKSPVDAAMLQGWTILPASRLPSELQKQVRDAWVITPKAPIHAELDQRIVLGFKTGVVRADANQWAATP